jgi:amidase
MDFLRLDATDQLRVLAEGRISAIEALELAMARADEATRSLNAVVARRADQARSEARAIDSARSRGEPLGRLAGLPLTVKDTLDIAGMAASAGRADLKGRDVVDADVVARVRTEGAVVWGQTNTPVNAGDWQSFNPLYGVTNNPWNPSLTPGGSSGGSAAALAAGITALEIGADIAGSLRVPASFCGVFAHKPSFGMVSQAGLAPPSVKEFDIAVVGPMARSVRDLDLLFSVLADYAPQASPPLRDLRIGLWLEEPGFALDPEVADIIGRFGGALRAQGARVELTRGPVVGDEVLETYTSLMYPLLWEDAPARELALYRALRGPAKAARRLGAGPLSWAKGVLGATSTPTERQTAQEARAGRVDAVAEFFQRFDVLIAPCAPTPAFAHDHRSIQLRRLRLSDGRRVNYLQMMAWCALASVWGLPATAVPVGLTMDKRPVGVQLIGARGEDARVLAAARAIEQALGGFTPPPG